MLNADLLTTAALRGHPRGAAVVRVLAAALAAVEPGAAVRQYLHRDDQQLWVGAQWYDLSVIDHVVALAIGKAGAPMLVAVADVLGDRLSIGLAIVKDGHGLDDPRVVCLEAGHPVPDARGIIAAGRAVAFVEQLTERDLLLVLISGGGSALVTLPVSGVSLDDIQVLTRALLACGATIGEINTLRKHLDQVKGGGLARLAAPAQIATLILSDVVGDPLDVIASGPTVPDPTSFADALGILDRYGIRERIPASIVAHLYAGIQGAIPETPKPGDPLFQRVANVLVGSNRLAAEAALRVAQLEGFAPLLLTTSLQGEAREVGQAFSAIVREAAQSGNPIARPCCILAGGETTVTLRGDGRGGRNQELALACVTPLAGMADLLLVALATDGGDGPTDAAGAVVTGASLARAQVLGLDPAAALANNDAYHFFDALGDLLKPGPTRTNVNDLTFVFLG